MLSGLVMAHHSAVSSLAAMIALMPPGVGPLGELTPTTINTLSNGVRRKIPCYQGIPLARTGRIEENGGKGRGVRLRAPLTGEAALGRLRMRDLSALLNSLTNVTRDQLIAILQSEASAAEQLAKNSDGRTPKQRARHREALERRARLRNMIAYFEGTPPEGMAHLDLTTCRALEQRLHSS